MTVSPQALGEAFGVLLGQPLDRFSTDSTYAAFLVPPRDRVVSYLRFAVERPAEAGWLVQPGSVDLGQGVRLALGFSQALFAIEAASAQRAAPQTGIEFARFAGASEPTNDPNVALLTARRLAAFLLEHYLDVSALARFGLVTGAVVPIPCDGTLIDALSAATGTRPGFRPRTFADVPGVSDAGRASTRQFDAVTDPALREHLATYRIGFDDAETNHWYFAGPTDTGRWRLGDFPAPEAFNWQIVAGWYETLTPGAAIVVTKWN